MTRDELVRVLETTLSMGGHNIALRAEVVRQILEVLKLPVFPATLTPELNDVIRSARANTNYRQNEGLHRDILKHLMPKPLTMFVFYATQVNNYNEPNVPKIFRHKTKEGADKNRDAAIRLSPDCYINVSEVIEVPRDVNDPPLGS